jgi:heterotetrameric sarcosine oxidase gamma subunit
MHNPLEAAPGDVLQMSVLRDRSIARLMSWKPCAELPGPAYWQRRLLPGVGAVFDGDPRVLCTSPAEWLLVFSSPSDVNIDKTMAAEQSAQSLAVVDVTPGMSVVELRGPAAPRVLTQSCALNLRHLEAGHCERVRFANIPVVVHCVRTLNVFELYFARGYGSYLMSWLANVAKSIQNQRTASTDPLLA